MQSLSKPNLLSLLFPALKYKREFKSVDQHTENIKRLVNEYI